MSSIHSASTDEHQANSKLLLSIVLRDQLKDGSYSVDRPSCRCLLLHWRLRELLHLFVFYANVHVFLVHRWLRAEDQEAAEAQTQARFPQKRIKASSQPQRAQPWPFIFDDRKGCAATPGTSYRPKQEQGWSLMSAETHSIPSTALNCSVLPHTHFLLDL